MQLKSGERERVKQLYSHEVLYQLCRVVRGIFQQEYPDMTISTEQCFVDAVEWLDSLFNAGSEAKEWCEDLWNDALTYYRENDRTREETQVSKAKVAMLFYLLMYSMQSTHSAFFKGTIQRLLHHMLHERWGHERCLAIEQRLTAVVNPYGPFMADWMEDYIKSDESLLCRLDEEMLEKEVNITPECAADKRTAYYLETQRQSLTASNQIFREELVVQGKVWTIHFAKLHLFIREHLIQHRPTSYEWMALFLFFCDCNLLAVDQIEHFATQMRRWFPSENCPDDFRHFTILKGMKPEDWEKTVKGEKKNINRTSIANIKRRYDALQKAFHIAEISGCKPI